MNIGIAGLVGMLGTLSEPRSSSIGIGPPRFSKAETIGGPSEIRATYRKGSPRGRMKGGYGQCEACHGTVGRARVCMNRACKLFNK